MAPLNMIEAVGLTKAYGETQALAGVDFAVPAGSILGVLGPNGAGKTTAVRILTTLATPDDGQATVAGFDIRTQATDVRRQIGVTAQDATLDGMLTGRQNLALIGELSRMGRVGLQGAGGRAVGSLRADVRRRPDPEGLLGRHAPAPRPGGEPHDPAARLVPGRADDRARPHQPPTGVGRHPGIGGRRRHALADHPIPGGGRHTGRQHHRDRPWTGHRRGDTA